MSSLQAINVRDTTAKDSWMAWMVCLSAGLFFFYEFFQLNVFDVINTPLREAFNIDATQIGWMSSAYLWADIIFLIPAGIILDRFPVRRVILTALMVCIIGTVGFAVATSFVFASLCHFLSGIGNAFCFLSCAVLVSRWFEPGRRALVIGCVVTMAFLGGAFAHTPFARLYEWCGWRNALLIDGGVGLVFFVWIYGFVHDGAEHILDSNPNCQKSSPRFLEVLYNPQNWWCGLYTSALNLPIMVLCALWGHNYLQEVHHLSSLPASNVVSTILIGSIIGCPLVGWASDLLQARIRMMRWCAVASLLCIIPLLFGQSLSEWILYVIFFAVGFFTSAQVLSYPLIAESNRPENVGAATGAASMIIMGGAGIAQVVFGFLMEQHRAITLGSHYSSGDYQYAMLLFPVMFVVAIIVTFFTREAFSKP